MLSGSSLGHFYLELQSNGLPEQTKANNALLELAETTGVPLVATNDCHYLTADDAEANRRGIQRSGTGTDVSPEK